MAAVSEQAMALSVDEKLRLIDALWESMAKGAEPDCYLKDGKIVFANEEQRARFGEALDEIERGDFVA